MHGSNFRLAAIGLASILFAACGGSGDDTTVAANAADARTGALKLQQAQADAAARIDRRLLGASGPVEVWVTLEANSLSRARALLAETPGEERQRALAAGARDGAAVAESAGVRAAMRAQRSHILAQQAATGARLASLGAVELARVNVAHNAIAVVVDAAQLEAVAAVPGVVRVRPVLHYQMMLGETVPYVGAAALQATGYDGAGTRIAVLDSGVDYTHRNLGGPGTVAAYNDCYAQRDVAVSGACASLFGPGAPKVIGGYDFVGEAWPGTAASPAARTEDPNPIDLEGHGTHVADIAAGRSADGLHKGVAPGAKIIAVKVCSAVSSSCNGVALLKGMDFALDPNGDGDFGDAADVINLSLGSDYGQVEDDLTEAVTNAVSLGTIVAVAAGNGSNKIYNVSSPSISPGALSVAQTAVPSAAAQPLVITAPAAIAGVYGNAATLPWAPIAGAVSGEVVFVGRGCATDPPLANPAGKIALIDRGTCNISEKVDKAARAGAIATLIGLVAPGDAVSFVLGNGTSFVPSLVITQATATTIKRSLAGGETVSARLSPADRIPLVGSVESTSARGPSISTQGIKPEIGAPGASVSASSGTGGGERAFGGTSGATPMVAGAAALMVQAHPHRSALQIKAMLMNSAEPSTQTSPATVPGERAPATRVGAGELRVNRAVQLVTSAWDREALSATLAFGVHEVDRRTVLRRVLTVENYATHHKRFAISTSFREAADEASGAVRLIAPPYVDVAAGSRARVVVEMIIDPDKLPEWQLNGGTQGGNGAGLNRPEYDGTMVLRSGNQVLSVPWHVLPRKAARVLAAPAGGRAGKQLLLTNLGAEQGEYDLYSLTGTSPRLPKSQRPAPGDNFALVDLKGVGVRYLPGSLTGAGDLLEFAISLYDRAAHPVYPAGVEVDIDTDGDGNPDWAVFTTELVGFGGSGQSAVVLYQIATGANAIYFFNDADLNSGVQRLLVPMNSSAGTPLHLGVAPGKTITFSVLAYDSYFTGLVTDFIDGMKFTPGAARYDVPAGGDPFGTVARGRPQRVPYKTDAAVTNAQSTETGLMLTYRRNAGVETQEFKLPR
jgi:subtilisin family serine protease